MYNDRFGTRAHRKVRVKQICLVIFTFEYILYNYEIGFSTNQLDGRHFSLHFQVFQVGHEKKRRTFNEIPIFPCNGLL